MCGVFGWLGDPGEWRHAHRLMVELAVAHEVRGIDAAGYAVLTSRGELLWRRQPGPARHLFCGDDFAALYSRGVTMAIGHTRLATTGAPAVNGNNHPHRAGDWLLVTNGFIPAHEEKAKKLNLRLRFQCDSEILVQALHRYGEVDGPVVCLSLRGKQSVLVINARSRRMLAWTNGEMPLVAFRVDDIDGLWWASTEEIAQEALATVGLAARFAEARSGVVYRLDVTDGQVVIQTRRAQKIARNRRP